MPHARIKEEKQMGKMKTLGEDLKEKLEAYANAQGALNAGMQSMVVQGSGYSGQGLINSTQQSNALQNMFGASQAQTGSSHIRKGTSSVDDPNKREAYAMPLSRLADMWRARFGDTWIDVSELDEEFWMDASSRLHRNKLMEELEFRNSNTPWARLKEGV